MSNKINSKFKKTISLIISSSLVVFSVIPNVLAKDISINNIDKNTKENYDNKKINNNASTGYINIQENSNEKFNLNNFKKNHRFLYKFGKYSLYAGIINKVGKYGKLALREVCLRAYRAWYLRDVVTKIDGYSEEEINQHLNEEIEKYKNREKNIFKIDEKLIEKADKRLLLLTLMKLNYLFDKYNKFTKDLIEHKNKKTGNDKEFVLRLMNTKDDLPEFLKGEAMTEFDLGGIAFSNLSNFKQKLYEYKVSVKLGFWSPSNIDELIDHAITHEFGHAMEILYIISIENVNIPKIRGMDMIDYLEMLIDAKKMKRKKKNHWFNKLNDAADSIKKEICKNTNSDEISIYGSTKSVEFFAEAFAYLECSNKEDINEIGKNTEKFIVEKMKYLLPENSKFCNNGITNIE